MHWSQDTHIDGNNLSHFRDTESFMRDTSFRPIVSEKKIRVHYKSLKVMLNKFSSEAPIHIAYIHRGPKGELMRW